MEFSRYLNGLPFEQLAVLYESPWTCLAVLRSLPSLSQQLALRLAFVDKPIPDSLLRGFVKSQYTEKCSKSLEVLKQLQVVQKVDKDCWQLEPTFRERLRQGVINPASIVQDQQEAQNEAATLEECTEHAESQWQKVLLALVEGRNAPLRPHKDLPGLGIQKLFLGAGLLDEVGELTQDGFKFLFTDLYSQLWLLLQHYLAQSSQQEGTQLARALSFLLQLSFRQASQPVDVKSLLPEQKNIGAHMAALGILYPAQAGNRLFLSPTFMAGMLSGGKQCSAGSSVAGFIVVETSFRVYAYTTSPVQKWTMEDNWVPFTGFPKEQIAVLQLFAKTECLLPNVFVGTLTGKSVTEALNRSITSQMIIKYLEDHRHPKVAHRHPVLPAAVKDQMMLWEKELNRLQCSAAALFNDFDTPTMFEKAVEKAKALGCHLFSDGASKRLVVDSDGEQAVRKHVKAMKQGL